MDMKRLEISRLMDEYEDNEFFPEGGTTADVEAVKNRVLNNLQGIELFPAEGSTADMQTVKVWTRKKAAPKKRRVPPLTRVLLAAALAVGCVLMIAAGLPMKTYQLFTGGTMQADVELSGPNRHIYANLDDALPEDPLVLENGRLWLVLNGERADITDRIDGETPYIIESTDPESGLRSSLIVGGTPEDFGWCLWAELPNGGGYGALEHNNRTSYIVIDGVTYEYSRELEARSEEWDSWDIIYKPWYEKGERQITLWRK